MSTIPIGTSSPTAPLKLCIISHSYVEQANLPILSAMAAQPGVELSLITPERYMVDLQHASGTFQDGGARFRIERVPIRLGRRQGAFLYHAAPLGRALDAIRPDVILHEQEVFALGALQIARIADRRGLPLFMQVAENLPRDLILPRRLIRSYVLARCAGLLCWNNAGVAVHRDWSFPGPQVVVPGMAVAAMNPQPRFGRRNGDTFQVMYAGRLVASKGIDLLLRAVAMLRDRSLTVSCKLVGHGPERARLEALTRTLSLGGQVHFLGVLPQPQVLRLLRDSDALILPSRRTRTWEEQFGRVLVQAMAEATVTVGSRTGAIPDVIGDEALLFDEDHAEQLAAVLERLATENGRLERMQRQLWNRADTLYRNEILAAQKIAFVRRTLETLRGPSHGI